MARNVSVCRDIIKTRPLQTKVVVIIIVVVIIDSHPRSNFHISSFHTLLYHYKYIYIYIYIIHHTARMILSKSY